MKYTYACKKVSLKDSIRDYTEKRISKLERYFRGEDTSAAVTFSVEKNHLCTVEITIRDGATLLRAQTEAPDGDMRSAVDAAVGYIERQILKNKTRLSKRLRSENFPAPAPGRGSNVFLLPDGRKIAVLNIQGTTFMDALPCPFQAAYEFVNSLDDDVVFRFVDFHAEATSEKKAMGFALDGKVSAVFGTHTHVQTADAQILPNGTAYMTDLGMCGVELSCLGMSFESVLQRFVSKRPASFKRAVGQGALNGLLMELDDESGKALSVSLFRENAPRTKISSYELIETGQTQSAADAQKADSHE